MWKLAIVLIVLGYVAAGCGKAPAPGQNTVGVKRPVETYSNSNSITTKDSPSPQCGGTFQHSCQPYAPSVTYIPVCVIDGVPIYVAAQCAVAGTGG